jgi:hypothetical protein
MKRKARFQRTLASHGSFRRERSRERAGRSTGPLIIGRPLSVIAQRISISVGIFSGSIGLRVYWRGRRRKAKEWLFPGNSWHTSSRLVTTKVLWSARQIAAERAVLDNKCIHPTLCTTIPRAGLLPGDIVFALF